MYLLSRIQPGAYVSGKLQKAVWFRQLKRTAARTTVPKVLLTHRRAEPHDAMRRFDTLVSRSTQSNKQSVRLCRIYCLLIQ